MRKSDRLFTLANILRKHQPITASRLAEKLNVSERTIYRYIDDLSVAGIPVYGEPGLGYRLSEGFELPPLQLTALETEALVLGVNLVSAWTGKSMSEAAGSLLSKIEAGLPQSMSSGSGEARFIHTPNCHAIMDNHVWDTLYAALKTDRWVEIDYDSLQGNSTERQVRPLGVFFWGNTWTLASWCQLREDYRDFRLDRIRQISLSDSQPQLPKGISLAAYLQIQKDKAAAADY